MGIYLKWFYKRRFTDAEWATVTAQIKRIISVSGLEIGYGEFEWGGPIFTDDYLCYTGTEGTQGFYLSKLIPEGGFAVLGAELSYAIHQCKTSGGMGVAKHVLVMVASLIAAASVGAIKWTYEGYDELDEAAGRDLYHCCTTFWTTAMHHISMSREQKNCIKNVLLVSARVDDSVVGKRQNCGDVLTCTPLGQGLPAPEFEQLLLPGLPPEIWLYILMFVRKSDVGPPRVYSGITSAYARYPAHTLGMQSPLRSRVEEEQDDDFSKYFSKTAVYNRSFPLEDRINADVHDDDDEEEGVVGGFVQEDAFEEEAPQEEVSQEDGSGTGSGGSSGGGRGTGVATKKEAGSNMWMVALAIAVGVAAYFYTAQNAKNTAAIYVDEAVGGDVFDP